MKKPDRKRVVISFITIVSFISFIYLWGVKSYAEVSSTADVTSDKENIVIKSTLRLLKKDEGFRSNIYLDTLGNKTLGYGFKYSELNYDSTTITEQRAYEVLQIKVFNITEKLDKKKFYRDLQVKQKIAIISMVYQLGFKGFYKFKDTIEALEKHDYEKASAYAKDSLWCKQTPARCERISLMLIKKN